MRRVFLLLVLAGLLAVSLPVSPVIAQEATRQVRSVKTARTADGARLAAPDALRHDPAAAALRGLLAKPSEDPRPLRGLNNRHIPRYASVEAFMAGRPAGASGSLRTVPTPVGTARWVQRPASMQAAQGRAGKTVPGFAVGQTLRLERASNETVRWLRGALGRADAPGGASKQAAYTQAALGIAEAYAGVLGLDDPAAELRAMHTQQDDLGYVHARFEQVYQGLRVWGRDLYIHFDATGEAYALNGTYEPTPTGIATRPTLDAVTALRTVVDDLTARGRWEPLPADVAAWLGVEGPQTELLLYPDPDRGMRLAYEVSVHPNLLEWYTYLVDAQTGAVLGRVARHCTLHYTPNLPAPVKVKGLTRPHPPSDAPTRAGFFDATGTDLNGTTQDLRVYQHDDNLFYTVWDLDNLNPNSTLPNEPDGGALTIDANATDLGEAVNLTHVTSANNTWNDPSSVSAHANMNTAYRYYKDTHNRNAIDGNDQSLISIIHVTDEGRAMDNAFWSGRVMAYGDGDQAFLPLAGALDVAAHEFTHGVIQNTAGLVYQFQPGALNESFADVFGVLVEPNDFLLGEDIMRANASALRDLLNPDNPNVLSDQPAHMRDFRNLNADQDNGGVHINSGIPNRAAALIIQIVGIEPAEQIYYRALTTYLTRNSQFGDARNALEQAAIDLFGDNSSVHRAVQQSFDDVGILSTAGEGGQEGNDLPPQTGGASLVAFLTDDGSIGLLDLTDANNTTVGLFSDPAAVARVDNQTGDRTQLSTPLNGETIYFINDENKLAVLQVESGLVSVFDDLFIQQEGDLWNAAISPDENFVALVSAYAEDPTLYIYNFQQLGAIDLLPETTQEGIEDETIQFPDVVSWSPNPQLPRIVFDAFNEVTFNERTIDYWSIYEIDFAAGTIFNLIPAQPTDISVGNITYSSTDPDQVAFNTFTDEGEWDVLVGNFETGDVEALNIPNFTIDSQNITDAQRPSFSPDDTEIVFSSANFGVLLFYDRAGGSLSFLDLETTLGSAPYNPRWFVRGGSGGTSNQAPTAGFTASTTAGEAPLLVSFNAGLSNDPDGDPLTYRWNFGDGTIGSGASVSHTFVASGTRSVTLTVTDSGGLSDTATQQVVVGTPATTVMLRNFDPQLEQFVWFADSEAPNDSGFVHGTNWFEDRAKATAITLPTGVGQGRVTGVNVWFAFKRDGLANEMYTIEILDGTAQSGPGALLGSQQFRLADVNADADADTAEPPTNHVLNQPVTVGPSFFVSVDFGTYTQANWAAATLVASDRLGQRIAEDWEKWGDGTWHNMSDAWFGQNATPGTGNDGWTMWVEAVVETGTNTSTEDDDATLPRTFSLGANYPNPFTGSTRLQVALPARAEVDLRVIDLLGRTVATLVEGPMEAGVHTVRFDAEGLPSGVYLARLRAGSAMLTRTMVLVR